MRRPKQRSSIARRVLLAVLLCLAVLVGGFAGIIWWAYDSILVALAQTAPEAQTLPAVEQLALAQAEILWPLAVAVVALTLLLALALARWAVRPLNQLVVAASSLTGNVEPRLPVRAVGEVGQLARNFNDLSDLLIRSSRELEKQNRLMNESVSRLEGMLKVSQELSLVLEPEQLLRRAADLLHDTLGYERASAALIEGETLAFYGQSGSETGAAPTRAPLNEHSVAGLAALTGAAVRVDDLKVPPGYIAAPGLATARAELAVPVIINRQVLAVLDVQSTNAQAFVTQDEEQLGVLAQVLGGALANSSRFQDEQLRRQMAEAIHRVSQTLSGALVSARVPELILDQLAQVLPFDRSALLLIDGGYVETTATRGYRDEQILAHARAPLRDLPLIAEMTAQSAPLVLTDATSDPRYRPTSGTSPARSWLGAPLIRHGLVSGVLVLESDQPDRYGKEELMAMTAIANQASIALENARLYTEAQDRAQRLEVITQITQLISTRDVIRELQGILRTSVHLIRRVVPCDYAALALYNDEEDTFTVETVYDFAVRDWSELPAGQRVEANGTPWQMAGRTTGPVLQSDLSRSAFAIDRQLATTGLQSSVVVPIIGANQPIGALMFASRDSSAYGQPQIATLLELSHYLGPALYNARLNQQREETANQLARTQEHLNLVDKVRVVGQLASGVAHDFNNLLAGILGNAQLLLFEIQDSEQREMLRVIERAAKDGSETVRRLQGFARMEHDSPMTEVRLDMLARDAIDITRPRWRDVAQSRGVSIEIDRRLQPVTPIAGRPAELREVITNLIINAVDAMPRGGSITISTYDALSHDSQGDVVMEVADTGVGMPPEVRSRIFDPFFTTKGDHGTGLGLAVSLGIVQSHGGQIDVLSELGHGTRFVIRLPVRAADAVVPGREAEKNVPIIPGHLLFVESEPMIREAVVRLLMRWGHQVTQVTGGVEALRTFQPDMFDVVISDLGMPDMSGWDLLAQIKQRDSRVSTVLLTGWGRQLSEDEARERGADFVIEKPFDQDMLRGVLAKAMTRK